MPGVRSRAWTAFLQLGDPGQDRTSLGHHGVDRTGAAAWTSEEEVCRGLG